MANLGYKFGGLIVMCVLNSTILPSFIKSIVIMTKNKNKSTAESIRYLSVKT